MIDDVEVKKVAELSPRDIEHDNPEFRRREETVDFLEKIYTRPISDDDTVTVIRFSQIVERPSTQFGNGETPSRTDPPATRRRARPMAEYRFLTTWLLEAERERVWDAIYESERWPEWWKGVLEAEKLEEGDEAGVGQYGRYVWKSRLPYRLEFFVRTTKVERPHLLEGDASGELAGVGRWRLFEQDGVTAVLYEWNVRTTQGLDEPARAGRAPDLRRQPRLRDAKRRPRPGQAARRPLLAID